LSAVSRETAALPQMTEKVGFVTGIVPLVRASFEPDQS